MMDVRLTSDGAQVMGVEGTVWHEKFTMAEARDLAFALDSMHEGLNVPGGSLIAEQVHRLANMFHALTNDSDACIVTVEPGV